MEGVDFMIEEGLPFVIPDPHRHGTQDLRPVDVIIIPLHLSGDSTQGLFPHKIGGTVEIGHTRLMVGGGRTPVHHPTMVLGAAARAQ